MRLVGESGNKRTTRSSSREVGKRVPTFFCSPKRRELSSKIVGKRPIQAVLDKLIGWAMSNDHPGL